MLNYQDSEKSGKGFTSGEFDIHPNGSLIINNVTLQHGNSFGVTLFFSRTKIPDTWVIEVQVISKFIVWIYFTVLFYKFVLFMYFPLILSIEPSAVCIIYIIFTNIAYLNWQENIKIYVKYRFAMLA